MGLASRTQLSLFNSQLSHLGVPQADLLGGICSLPQPLFGGAKQSFLAGKAPTSLLGCKLWGLGWGWWTVWAPAGYLLTLNNRKHFSGVWERNSYFKFMWVVVCSLILKRIFVILQLDKKT